jgi:hypothetical protein
MGVLRLEAGAINNTQKMPAEPQGGSVVIPTGRVGNESFFAVSEACLVVRRRNRGGVCLVEPRLTPMCRRNSCQSCQRFSSISASTGAERSASATLMPLMPDRHVTAGQAGPK